ncbi:RNA-binding protein SGN1 [Entamoeba marina]
MKAERNEQNSRSIHITGVDYSTTEQQLQDFFRLCGTILRVTIPKNANTGKPMGYGNIEFDNTNSVSNSLKLSGAILNGRKIIVSKKVYVPKSKKTSFKWF